VVELLFIAAPYVERFQSNYISLARRLTPFKTEKSLLVFSGSQFIFFQSLRSIFFSRTAASLNPFPISLHIQQTILPLSKQSIPVIPPINSFLMALPVHQSQ
jgi:hypothetical protein